MLPHTRALASAAAYALVSQRKVAGLYDFAAARHLRLAAEARGDHLQGYDGDRDARFGGTAPELRDAGDGAQLHLTVEGATARGYDRSSASHFVVEVGEAQVQLFDHQAGNWFSYTVQVA